jgi:hypothetical protein
MIMGIIIIISIVISIIWVNGIAYMNDNFPDYKGEDFLNPEDKNDIT